jgi:CRP/FNR family cyclic AMP-dependent transcriptional regulator
LLFESCKKLQNITLSKLNYFNFSEWYFADSYLPSFYMLAQLNRVVSMFTFVVYMKARPDPHASHEKKAPFSPQLLLRNAGLRAKIQAFLQKQVIFPQDGPAATLFYIREGRVRLTLLSSEGKAATITILGKGEFLGEECLVPRHNLRLASAVAVNDCSLLEIGKNRMLAALDTDHALASSFMQSLLMRKIHAEDNLADRLFHSSEKRLVRLLLLLAGSGTNGRTKRNLPEISQEVLAEMVGTTRPRISYFMTKFRKLGLVDYSRGLRVRKELKSVLR